jgi:hypothetical protein
MFGVKGNLGDLGLEPKLVLEQFDENQQAAVELIFADRKMTIQYSNTKNKEYGDYTIGRVTLDGIICEFESDQKVIRRNKIDILDQSKEHIVLVELV